MVLTQQVVAVGAVALMLSEQQQELALVEMVAMV
jgi:hypothetical protein